MNDKLFQLIVAIPNNISFDGMAEKVELNTMEGYIGVLKNHIPLISVIKSGIMKITTENEVKEIMLHGGIIKILGDKVMVIGE